MNTPTSNGCNDCNPCNDCNEETLPVTCAVKLDSSCILYNIIGEGPSLLTGLNLPNGSNLSQILNAIDSKLNGLTGYNITTFNLTYLRDEYSITNLQTVVEALNNKIYDNTSRVIRLENHYNNLSNLYLDLLSKFNNPQLSPLYNIIIDQGDSINEAITKIINYLGELSDNGGISSSSNLLALSTSTIAFATSGNQNHTITANVVISPDASNLLKLKGNGLFVEPIKQNISFDPISRKVCLSNDGGCFILPVDKNTFEESALIAINSDTVEFVTSGKNGHTITANVNAQSILNIITNNPVLRTQFCNVCNVDPCTGQSIAASWTELGETRCAANYVLEKKQKDNNRCSSTYNTYRWVTAQNNSLLCGYQSLAYCLKLDCSTKVCTDSGCKSIQICLLNSLTNQPVAVNEDIEIFYSLSVNGIVSQKSVTLHQGLSSIEGICHCGAVNDTIVISNIEAIGQLTDNNGIGFVLCNNTNVPVPTPPVVIPTSVNNATLTQDCINYTMRVVGNFLAPNGATRTISLFKDYNFVEVKTVTANTFDVTFNNIVGGTSYMVKILEEGNVSNVFNSQIYIAPCIIQVSSAVNASCGDRSVTVTGSMGDALSVNIDLLKGGFLIANKTVNGPDYTTKFTNLEDGYYYAEVKPTGAEQESISSNVTYLSCATTPTTVPTQQSNIVIDNNCSNNTVSTQGILVGATRIAIVLYKDNVIVDTRQDLVGPNFTATFNNVLNGNYKVRVYEINNDPNTRTSSVLTVNCSTVTVPTNPPANPSNYITRSGDCEGRALTVDVGISNINGTGIVLYKDGNVYRTIDNVSGQRYFWTFNNLDQNGVYSVRVFELNNDSNSIVSDTITFNCAPAPVVTPSPVQDAPNAISISSDCALQSIAVDISLTNTNGLNIYLYKNNVIYRQKENVTGHAFITSFTGIADNGTYKIKVSEVNNDSNSLTSSDTVFTCNAVPDPVCTRPQNLTAFKLYYNYQPVLNSDSYTFTSLENACSNGQGYYDGTVAGASGFIAQSAGLSIGNKLYIGTGTSCDVVSDNYYYVADQYNNNTVHKAIKTDNLGNITDVLDCVTTPQVEPLGVVTINLHYDNQYRYPYRVATSTVPSNWDERWSNGHAPALYYASRIQFKSGIYNGQSALSNHFDKSNRYVGGTNAETAVAVASYDSIPYPGSTPDAVFNRFMISCKRLRERGYSGTIELDIYTKLITNTVDSNYISVKLGSQGTDAGDIITKPAQNGTDFDISGTTRLKGDTGNVTAINRNVINEEVKIAKAVINLTTNSVTIVNV